MLLKKMSFIAFAVAATLFMVSTQVVATELEDTVVLAEEAILEMQKQKEYEMDVSGYADIEYSMGSAGYSGFRMHHLSLFFQKKVAEKWFFFSEIEYEDAVLFDLEESSTSVDVGNNASTLDYVSGAASGKLFVEAVNLSYQWRPEATFRVGRFFTPAGIWSIDHYPPFVSTAVRPGHIGNIFPKLVDGAMAFGALRFGHTFLYYDAYVSNGEGNTGKQDNNHDKALGLRASLKLPVPMFRLFELGSTVYSDPKDSAHSDQQKTSLGADAKIRFSDFLFQTEAAFARFQAESGTAVSSVSGYYAQLAYAPNQWALGYRYDNYDEDRSKGGELITNTLFVNYRVTPNLVFKLEHHLVNDANDQSSNKTIASMAAYLN